MPSTFSYPSSVTKVSQACNLGPKSNTINLLTLDIFFRTSFLNTSGENSTTNIFQNVLRTFFKTYFEHIVSLKFSLLFQLMFITAWWLLLNITSHSWPKWCLFSTLSEGTKGSLLFGGTVNSSAVRRTLTMLKSVERCIGIFPDAPDVIQKGVRESIMVPISFPLPIPAMNIFCAVQRAS